jgi:hypothetical protein
MMFLKWIKQKIQIKETYHHKVNLYQLQVVVHQHMCQDHLWDAVHQHMCQDHLQVGVHLPKYLLQ